MKWQDSSWTPTVVGNLSHPVTHLFLTYPGKRRHREGKWPAPKSGFQEPTPPAHPRKWGGKGQCRKRSDRSWLGRTEKEGQAYGAEGGRGCQPSAGAPPAGHRCSRSRRLRVQEAAQLWRAVFSPQSRAGRAPESRPHLLTLTHGKCKAQRRSDLLKGSQRARRMRVS